MSTLVWRFEVASLTSLDIKELVLVDAKLGSVALSFNQVHTVKNRQTHDANNTTSLPGTLVCDESNPTCSGGDSHEVAAHIYAGTTYDFYNTEHSRDSIDDAGMTMVSTVHYGSSYANAFWNGSQMVYGDGFGFPLAEDVVAHELTHGVTQHESGLFYFYQSGAINESLSDVWGEFVDQENNSTGGLLTDNDSAAVRWKIGEDVSGLGAIRDMQDPTLFSQPDKMTSPNYYCEQSQLGGGGDNGGVHYNSGVNNKAVYLMTDGGTFNGYTVTGLGYEKVADLYYEAQTNLLTSAADYADLYLALNQACTNLGYSSTDCQQVRNAIDAVEMYLQPPSCEAPEAPICDGGTYPSNLFFDDVESGSGNWSSGSNSGSNLWAVPQTSTFAPGWNIPYATSGVGNIWEYNQASTSDTFLAMNSDVVLPANAQMHFNHSFGFESDINGRYDGGILEYSTNGGTTWNDADPLITDNGYNGNIHSFSGNPLAGDSAFTADSRGYISSRLDLSSLVGQNVRFRFRMGTDTVVADYGWFMDDVRIYTCEAATTVCAASQTIQSNGSGDWNDPNTWNPVRVPDENDVVQINAGHTVTGDATSMEVTSLCNSGTLQSASGEDLEIEASDLINNEGMIWGADGTDGSGSSASTYVHATDGSSLELTADSFYNAVTGDIQAGRGGHEQTYIPFTGQYIDSQGGDGGQVEIYAQNITNEGLIGPDLNTNTGASASHIPLGTVDGGNGGVADNFDNPPGSGPHLENDGDATGGDGGETILVASNTVINTSTGRICSGNGGFANVGGSSGQFPATAGTAGNVVFSAPSTTNNGVICAGNDGQVAWEPSMMMAGSNARIYGAQDITIFGGDHWTLDLSDLSTEAISATNMITIAVGKGSSVDLRGIANDALQAGSQVTILADQVLLDDGSTLSDAIDAPNIVTGPAQLLYDVALTAPQKATGEAGETLSIDLSLLNNSPVADAYQLEVSDSQGWSLSALPSSLVVDSLAREELSLEVTVPSVPTVRNVITVKATSLSDADVHATASISVHSVNEIALCDLTITKEHQGQFFYGQSGVYRLTTSNNGDGICEGSITITDTLPTGISVPPGNFNNGDWSCTADALNPQTITCTHPGPVPPTSNLRPITLTVDVPDVASAGGSGWNGDVAENCATVEGPNDSDTTNNNSCDQATVTQSDRNISLTTGWNIVSVPVQPTDTDITQVLASIAGSYDLVYAYNACDTVDQWKKYDPSAPPFANDLTDVDETMGLWVNMTVTDTLSVSGTTPGTTDIPLCEGWNLTGNPSSQQLPVADALTSISGAYDLIYAYDAADTADPWKKYDPSAPPFANDLTEMGAGWGYWIDANQDATWTVSNLIALP